eukprot:3014622-Pyramimonas_sp.AAC.1
MAVAGPLSSGTPPSSAAVTCGFEVGQHNPSARPRQRSGAQTNASTAEAMECRPYPKPMMSATINPANVVQHNKGQP